MGKLLQKLVTGIVPSWLTKIKSDASPKKLLPHFKGSTHASSSSSPSSSSVRHDTVAPPLIAHANTNHSIEDDDHLCTKACVENPVISESPSLVKQEKAPSIKQEAHRSHENHDHHHRDRNDPHHLQHVDVKHYSNQGMHEHDMISCTPPGTPSSRKQGTQSIHKDKHTQQHQKICKNQPGLKERNLRMPEADNYHHQDARGGRHRTELCDFFELEDGHHRRRELCNFFELEDAMHAQEDNHHNHCDKGDSHKVEIADEQCKNLYHDLLGLKRKSQYLQEEEEQGGEEEENEGGSHGSSNITHMTAWEWKRRKGERGVMSCELPESICSIVGNGRAVVKHSQDPEMVLWESMVEMIVGNGLWELGSLEFLLFCYLSLNEPHLHPMIQSSFLQVLKDLEKI